MTVEEERQLERECQALGALFNQVVSDMKVQQTVKQYKKSPCRHVI